MSPLRKVLFEDFLLCNQLIFNIHILMKKPKIGFSEWTQAMKKLIIMIALGAIGFGASAQIDVLSNGNVGIGRIDPAYSLDVLGTNISGNVGSFRVLYKNGGHLTNTEFSALTYTTSIGGNNNWTALYAKQGYANKAGVFDGDVAIFGNVGIGTNVPTRKLHLTDGDILLETVGKNLLFANNTTSCLTWGIEYCNGTSYGDAAGLNFWRPWNPSPYHNFHMNYVLFLHDNGNVGINTCNPTEKLHVNGNAFIDAYNTCNWGRAIWTKVYTKSACAYHLWNTVYNKDVFFVCGEGYLWTMKGGYFGSDISLKQNILAIEQPIASIKLLNGVKYQFIDVESENLLGCNDTSVCQGNGYRFGLIAQEVEAVMPEIVKEMPDGTKAITYTDLIAVLIEGVKEQQTVIEQQQSKIDTLQETVSELSNIVNEIQGNNENVEILGTLRVINHIDYQDIATQISVNQDLTKAFLVTNTFAVADTNVFCIYGNGDVNAKKIYAEELVVTPNAKNIFLQDSVFDKDYKLMSLSELEQFIKTNKHLPEISSEREINENGVNLLDMQGKLLMKIEELTLHIIEQQNVIENLQQEAETRNNEMQQEIVSLKEALKACCNTNKHKSMEDDDENTNIQQFNLTFPTDANADEMKVYQNIPNPFNTNTTIQCYIPQTIQHVELCVYNMQGKQLKCLPVSGRGTTTVQIQAGQLAAGVYTYLLIGDGQTSDAKQMILTK